MGYNFEFRPVFLKSKDLPNGSAGGVQRGPVGRRHPSTPRSEKSQKMDADGASDEVTVETRDPTI